MDVEIICNSNKSKHLLHHVNKEEKRQKCLIHIFMEYPRCCGGQIIMISPKLLSKQALI
jgi:hypothetical protein